MHKVGHGMIGHKLCNQEYCPFVHFTKGREKAVQFPYFSPPSGTTLSCFLHTRGSARVLWERQRPDVGGGRDGH